MRDASAWAARRYAAQKAANAKQETPFNRLPDLPDQLGAFNEARRLMLGNQPIDPDGVPTLLGAWGSPGGRGPNPEERS